MTVTPNTDTSQVRDLNRVLDWLDKAEAYLTRLYADHPWESVFATNSDLDYEQRLYTIIYYNCQQSLLRIAEADKGDDESYEDFFKRLPLIEYILTASITCELTFQQIKDSAGLEDSFLVFNVNDYVPSLVKHLAELAGDLDEERFIKTCFTPISTFIDSTNDSSTGGSSE